MAAQGPAAQGSERAYSVSRARERTRVLRAPARSPSPRLPGVSGPEPDMEPQVSGGRRGDDSAGAAALPSALTGWRPRSGRRGSRSAWPAPWESDVRGERRRQAAAPEGGGRWPAFLQLQGAPAPFLTFMYPGFPVSNLQACLNTFLSRSFSVSLEMASSPGETVTEAESLLRPFVSCLRSRLWASEGKRGGVLLRTS